VGKNFLQRQKQHDIDLMRDVERIIKQLCMDCWQVTLHEEAGIGRQRLEKLTDAFLENYSKFDEILLGTVESDVWQARLDNALLDIVKDQDKLIPFNKRYPEIREIPIWKPLKRVKK